MTVRQDGGGNALALADLMERWAESIPMWDAEGFEPWDEFADRRYRAEMALKAKLRALPTCNLRSDPTSTYVELTLADIRARSEAGVAGACRAWAAEVRRWMSES